MSKTKIVVFAPRLRFLSNAMELSSPYCFETEHKVAVPLNNSIMNVLLSSVSRQSRRNRQNDLFDCPSLGCLGSGWSIKQRGSAQTCQPFWHLLPSAAKSHPPMLYAKQIGSPLAVLCHFPFRDNGKGGVLPFLPLPFDLPSCCDWRFCFVAAYGASLADPDAPCGAR